MEGKLYFLALQQWGNFNLVPIHLTGVNFISQLLIMSFNFQNQVDFIFNKIHL